MIPWLMISIAIVILILFIVMVIITKGKKKPMDYYTLFIIGLTWIPLGLAMKNPALWIMGLIFFAVGITNKNKWDQNRKTWAKLTQKEKKIQMIAIGIGFLLLIAGIAAFFLIQR